MFLTRVRTPLPPHQAPSFGLAATGFPRFDSLEDLDETMLSGALFGDLNGRGGGTPYFGTVSGYPAAPAPPSYGSGPPGYGSGQFSEYAGPGPGDDGGPYGGPTGRSWDHPQEGHAAPSSHPVPQLPPAQPGLVPHHGLPGSAAARGFNVPLSARAQLAEAQGPLKRGRQATPRAAVASKRAATAAAALAGRGGDAVAAAAHAGGPKAKRAPRVKKTPEQQRADRRERNRRHARCSRARKKLLIDALQNCIKGLQSENRTLKVRSKRPLSRGGSSLLL